MLDGSGERGRFASMRDAFGAPVRAHVALLVVSVLLPVILFGLASWRSYREVMREADTRVERTLRILHEHALKVFETQRLILGEIGERLRTVRWDDPADVAELQALLIRLKHENAQVAAIAITDAQGGMRVGARDDPSGAAPDYSDRDWFIALRDGGRGEPGASYVSHSYIGRQSGEAIFNLARRIDTREGAFAGAIAISVDRRYFETFWKEIDADVPHSATLVRDDGAFLARQPATRRSSVPREDLALLIRGTAGPIDRVSPIDGVQRIASFRKVGGFPVYIGFGLDVAALRESWWHDVESFAFIAGLSALALLAVSALALHQARQERIATRRWQVAADALAAEAAERRRAEAQLRQAQKMEAVGRLTGGIAHDFNNLLTVVIGNLEMAGRRTEGADPRVARGIAAAMDGARRAATLTHRLLAFSRQSPLTPEPFDPNRLVAGMSDLLRRTLGERIEVETVTPADLWWTRADVNGVESALLNLAVNARDAMPEGGRLTIETGNTFLDEAYCALHTELKHGQYAMIAVADTGTGMDPEVRARAFEPFFTTKPAGKGTGLGLAQVYGFAHQSGGHVAIQSEPGRGTVVRLYLPRLGRDEHPVEARLEVPSLLPGTQERAPRPGIGVLCVEDDAMVRAFSAAALEEAGYRVVQAGSGPEALVRLEEHPDIELLFTDVVLTGPLDGFQLAEEARQRRPGLKVLCTTGYTGSATVPQGGLDGTVSILPKPFTAAELGRTARAVLAGSSPATLARERFSAEEGAAADGVSAGREGGEAR